MKKIEVGGFTITREQKKLVNQALNDNRLSYGPLTREFERQWAELHGVKYALFCNSGTSALQVALHALKEKYKWDNQDEVIVPALTFVATMNIVLHNNMQPVFCDVEERYFNIDPDKIEACITGKTRAILPVHLLGQPAQMDKIMTIAKKYKLKVIEDSCETVGATYDNKPVGSFGDVSCFSTYASHLVVTGVGGFACTNDNDLAIRIKGLYNHGRDGVYHSIDDDDNGEVKMIESRFRFTHSGYSYRATELESALGLGHMKTLSKELSRRQSNADLLVDGLLDLESNGYINLPVIHPKATHSYMLFAIVCKMEGDREKLIPYLEKNGIMTRYMMPLLNQPIFRELFGNLDDKFPIASYLNKTAFLIGVHPGITRQDIDYIVQKMHKYYE